MVTTTTPGGQRVSICMCTRTGRHIATITRRPGSSLYTLATETPQVAASAQVSASGQVAASCSCRLLSHQTLLWHHRLGHPSLPRLRGMHSCLLVSGLPRSLPPLPPLPPLPCVEELQRAASHSSSFPPTTAPHQTLHMDAPGPGGARTKGTGGAATGGVGDAGAGDPTEPGGTGADGAGAGGTRVAGAGAVDPGAGGAGGTVRPRPYFFPLLQQFGGLTERHEPASRPVSPVHTARRVPCSRPPPVPGTHAMVFLYRLLLSPLFLRTLTRSLTALVLPVSVLLVSSPLLSLALPSSLLQRLLSLLSCLTLLLHVVCTTPLLLLLNLHLPALYPSEGECALGTDVLEDRQEDFECLAAAVPRFASMLLAPKGDPDAPDIPTPRSYAEAITGPYSSQWHAAMDAEMASWKSTGTYVDEVPTSRANIVNGMWIFRVKRPPGSPPAFKARYVARGFS
ncbi:unnamed protein product [Closterium sp. NIES-54]